MAKWTDIGAAKDFPKDRHVCVPAGHRELVVCNVEGELHAAANVCPHAHMPIGEGDLRGCVLTCPFHGYAFNVKTGKNVDFEDDIPLMKFAVRKNDGRVEVDLGEEG